jgi:hypothetical protein
LNKPTYDYNTMYDIFHEDSYMVCDKGCASKPDPEYVDIYIDSDKLAKIAFNMPGVIHQGSRVVNDKVKLSSKASRRAGR